MLAAGVSARAAIAQLMANDFNAARRQMAAIDRDGGVESYTGGGCHDWKGSLIGEGVAVQGNHLEGGEGCRSALDAFRAGSGDLAQRLLAGLAACEANGGDARGRQSAALLVVRPQVDPPVNILSDPTIDLRVDDHPQPVAELRRLLGVYELLHGTTQEEDRLPRETANVLRLQRALTRLGLLQSQPSGVFDDATRQAMTSAVRDRNLSRRVDATGWPDRRALEHLESDRA